MIVILPRYYCRLTSVKTFNMPTLWNCETIEGQCIDLQKCPGVTVTRACREETRTTAIF